MEIARAINSLACGVCLAFSVVSSTLANPGGATVVHGSVSFSQPNSHTLNITNTPGAIVNWQQFGINQGEITRFIQQGANSAILNRIVGQDPSRILGQLNSNGKVFLVNPNGIVFGQNSMVNTAGLIASTLNISNQDFINGNMRFADLQNAAEILNQGFISSSNNGEVVFVAPKITNEGTISVDNGSIVLAAGQSVTINSLNYDNIEFEVQAPDNKVVNLGEMITDGGSIGVFAGSITNKGSVSANAVTVDDAGNIVFVAQADTVIETGEITASSDTGKGGRIEITGDRVGVFTDSVIDASGATGGGEILVGGDYQGKNSQVKNSRKTVVSQNASLTADAKQSGDGGKVIVWSDENTYFSGNISAQGGATSGDGGFVEVSGKKGLGFDGYINTKATNGKLGSILLDPDFIIIQAGLAGSGPDDTAVLPNAINIDFAISPGATFFISEGSVEQLDGDITLQAEIDITLQAGVTLDLTSQVGGTTVTFQAGNSILIDGDIVISGGDLVLSASDPSATVPSPTGNIKINGKITTNDGNVTLNTNASSDQITISNDINTGAGKLDVRSLNNVIFDGGVFRTDFIMSTTGSAIDVLGDVSFDTVALDSVALTNSATISLINGPLDLINGTVITNTAGSGLIDIQGDLNISSSDASGTLDNFGKLKKSAGGLTSIISATYNANPGSEIYIDSGTLSLNGAALTLNSSALGGTGTFDGDVISNGGVIDVGSDLGATGTLSITGSLTLDSKSSVVFDLAGLAQSTQYDFLDVTGTVTLDGTLVILWENDFSASDLDTFDLIQTGGPAFLGAFASTYVPTGVTAHTFDFGNPQIMQFVTTTVAPNIFFWNLNADGFWDVLANWNDKAGSPAVALPSATDYVVINQDDEFINITIRDVRSVNGLETQNNLVFSNTGGLTIGGDSLIGGDTLTLGSSGGLTTNGDLLLVSQADWTSGSLLGTGSFTIHELGSLSINNSFTIASALQFNNNGSVILNPLAGPAVTLTAQSSGTHNGIWDTGNVGDSFAFNLGINDFNNGSLVLGSGLMRVSGGTQNFNTGSTISADMNIDVNGNVNFNAGSDIDPAVSIDFSGATLNFNDIAAETLANLTMSAGALGGTGDVVVTGLFNWSGSSSITGSGQLTTSGATTISANATHTVARDWVNDGTVDWQDGTITVNNATLTNNGTFNANGGTAFNNGGGIAVINNSVTGLLNINNALAINTGLQFDNDGVINLNPLAGPALTLTVLSAGTHTGTWNAVNAGDILLFNSGTNDFNSGALVTGNGTLQKNNGTVNFNLGSDISSTVSVDITGVGSLNFNDISTEVLANLTITGGTLGGTGDVTVLGAFNVNNSGTINGTGTLTSNGTTTISGVGTFAIGQNWVNAGTIDWQGVTLQLNNAITFTNDSVFDVNGGSILSFGSGTPIFHNSATGTINVNSDLTINSSSIQFDNDGAVNIDPLAGSDVIFTTFSNGVHTGTWNTGNVGDSILLNLGTNDFNSGTSVIGNGLLQISGGTQNFNTGSLVNADVDIITNGVVNFNSGSDIDPTVSIAFSGSALNFNDISAETITNFTVSGGSNVGGTGDLIVSGAFNWSGGLAIGGSGVLTTNGTSTVSVNTSHNMARDWVNAGTIDWQDGTIFINDATFTNNGTLNANGGTAFNNGGGTPLISNGVTGIFNINNNLAVNAGLQFDNTGAINISASTLTIGSTFNQNGGSINLAGGTLTIPTLTMIGGSLTGEGAINGDVDNQLGTIEPGGVDATGILTINGTFTQSSTGVLDIEVNNTGSVAGTDFDQLVINDSAVGAANIDGTLNVTLLNGPPPSGIRIIDVVGGGTLTGTFLSEVIDAAFVTPPTYGGSFVDLVLSSAGSLFTWTGLGDSVSWNDLANWDLAAIPTLLDDVTIGDFNITITGGGNAKTLTLGSAGSINLLSGTFTVANDSTLNGSFTMSGATFSNGGTITLGLSNFRISGSNTISGGVLSSSGGGQYIINSGLNIGNFNNVTIDSTATLIIQERGSLNINGGLVLDGSILMQSTSTSGVFTNINALSTQTISGTGSIVFDGSGNNNQIIVGADSSTLTIGAGITIETGVGNGTVGTQSGTNRNIINQGTIRSDVSGKKITLLDFSNENLIQGLSGGDIELVGDWTNTVTGTISMDGNGGTGILDIGTAGDDWTNLGAININNGTVLELGGNFTTAEFDSITPLTSDNIYRLALDAVLDATGGLVITTNTGDLHLRSGTINNGSIATDGTPGIDYIIDTGLNSGNFNNVTIDSTATLIIQERGSLNINGGLVLDGSILMQSTSTSGVFTNINALSTQTISGTGSIVFDGSGNNNQIIVGADSSTLTIGAGITIETGVGNGTVGTQSGTNRNIINQGTIRSDVSGKKITLLDFSNENLIQGLSGGDIELVGDWTNTVTGTISMDGNGGTGILDIGTAGDDWTNLGAININNGTVLELGGNFTTAEFDSITPLTSDNIYRLALDAVLDATGGLVITTNTGDLHLRSGTINNGSIATDGTPGIDYIIDTGLNSGNFNNVTIDSTATLIIQERGSLNINGGLVLDGSILMQSTSTSGVFTNINALSTQTISGTGSIVFDGSGNNNQIIVGADSSTLTIGAGITIETGVGNGTVGTLSGTNRNVINQGTIRSDTSGETITLLHVTNNGTLQAISGGDLIFSTGSFFNDGILDIGAGSTASTGNNNFTNNSGGTVAGTGNFNVGTGTFTNDGTVRPGGFDTTGILTITGAYTQGAGGILEIELEGTTPGEGAGFHDQLRVTGVTTIAGDLTIAEINGYTSNTSDTFRIIDATGGGSFAGSFASATAGYTLTPGADFFDIVRQFIGVFWEGVGGSFVGDGVNWTDGGNWSTGVAPTNVDDVLIDVFSVNIAGTADALSLTLNSGGILTLTSGTLTIGSDSTLDGDVNLVSGTLTGSGTITINGNFNWTGGSITGAVADLLFRTTGTTTINSTGTLGYLRNWVNDGTVNFTGGVLQMQNGADFTNNNIFNASGGTQITNNGGAGVELFTNAGGAQFNVNNDITMQAQQFDNAGTIIVTAGTTLSLNANGNDTGTWNIGNNTISITGANRTLGAGFNIVSSPGAILNLDGGDLTNNSGGLIVLPADITVNLINAGSAIDGVDDLQIDGAFNWSNGTMIGSGQIITAGLTTLNTGGLLPLQRDWVNNGTVDFILGNLQIQNGTAFTNNAVFNANGGTLISNNGGAGLELFTNASGGQFNVNNDIIMQAEQFDNAGTVTVGATRIFTLNANGIDSGTWDFGANTISIIGANRTLGVGFNILSTPGAILNLNGGDLTNSSGGLIALPANVTVNLMSAGSFIGGANDLQIDGAFNWTAGTLSGTGLLTTTGLSTLTFGGAVGFSRDWTIGNTGAVNFTSGVLQLQNGVTVTNDGIFNAVGGTQISNNGGAGLELFSNSVGSQFNVNNDITMQAEQFDNAGDITINGSTLTINNTYNQNAGSITLNAGVVTRTNLVMLGGTLQGGGTINGNVDNQSGVISPGGIGITGIITINGDYTQGVSGVIEIEIFDNVSAAGTGYDLLAITGQADLLGTLTLFPTGGYTVTNNDTIVPVTYGSKTANTFGTINAIGAETVTPTYTGNISTAGDLTLLLTIGAVAFVFDDGGVASNWDDPLNWAGNVLPGIGDDIDLGIFSVSLTTSENIGQLTIGLGGQLTLSGGAALTIGSSSTLDGQLNLSGGSLTITGITLTLNGGMNWDVASTITGGGTGTLLNAPGSVINITNNVSHIFTGLTVTNQGTTNYDPGVAGGTQLLLNGSTTFNNIGTFDFKNDNAVGRNSGTGIFNNTGQVIKSAGTGNASFSGGGSLTFNSTNATYNAGANGAIELNSTSNIMGTLTNTGNDLRFNSLITLVDGSAINGGVSLIGGSLSVPALSMATINGTLNWTGASLIDGTGNLVIAAGGVFNITGNVAHTFSAVTLDNFGTTNYASAGAFLLLNGSSTFNNNNVFNFTDDNSITRNSGVGTFNNTAGATIVKSAGAGTSSILSGASLTFTHTSATIDVQSGSLDLGGVLTLDAGSVLQGGGTFLGDVNNTAGIVQPGGAGNTGTLIINGNYTQGTNGSLIIEIAGTSASTNFDVLNITGGATLAGNLSINEINGYNAATTDGYTFITTATGFTGDFDGKYIYPVGYSKPLISGNDYQVNDLANNFVFFDNFNGNLQWNDANNWSAGFVPTTGLDVDTTAVSGSAILISAGTHSINNLITDSNINNTGGNFTVTGNVTVPDNFVYTQNGAAATTQFDGAFNDTSSAAVQINNSNGLMTINGSTVANISNNGDLIIDGTVTGNLTNDGTLSGSGTVTGNVTNGGEFNPGSSPGTFTVDGDLTLLSSSILNIEIAGLVQGVDYDELIVTGNVIFAGRLNVIVDNSTGYTGTLDDSFDPVSYSSGSGSLVLTASTGYGYELTIDGNKLNLLTTLVPGLFVPDVQSDVVTLTTTIQNITNIENIGDIEAELVSSEEEDEEEKGNALVCS